MSPARPSTKKKRAARAERPGDFIYFGGGVFEIDNAGKRRPRQDIGPDYVGKFKHKYFKP